MVYWQLIGIRYKNRVLTPVYGEDQTPSKLVLLQMQGIIQFMESKAAFVCPLIVKRRIFPRNGVIFLARFLMHNHLHLTLNNRNIRLVKPVFSKG